MKMESQMKTLLAGMALWTVLMNATVRADPVFNRPPEPCVPSGCTVEATSTNCSEALVTFTNLVVSPTNLCVGQTVAASVTQIISNGVQIITSSCTNSCGDSCTNNCPGPQTNTIAPSPANWWIVTGVGATPPSGSGLSASFTPTNVGNGTITFYAGWQHGCDTNSVTNSAPGSFTVRCPTQTVSSGAAYCGTATPVSQGEVQFGAAFTYCYDCANGWWISETVTTDSNDCPGGQLLTQTNVLQMPGGCVTDYITNPGFPSIAADCTTVNQQTVAIGPTQDTIGVCTYNNTQIVTCTRTNATHPWHGTVVTSSAAVTNSCNW
jgi:hypothetical protein